MHEYPLVFYFAVFVFVVWYTPWDVSLIVFVVVAYLSGLYAHRLFELLGFKRYPFEEYPYVFVIPLPFRFAFTTGNAIVLSKRLIETEQEDVVRAILYHELGHIKYRDFTTVFLLILVYYLFASYAKSKLLVFSYILLFFWAYWHMEARCDLFAKSKGAQIEKALEKFSLKWRLAFLRGTTNTRYQEYLMMLLIIFFMGIYFGRFFQ